MLIPSLSSFKLCGRFLCIICFSISLSSDLKRSCPLWPPPDLKRSCGETNNNFLCSEKMSCSSGGWKRSEVSNAWSFKTANLSRCGETLLYDLKRSCPLGLLLISKILWRNTSMSGFSGGRNRSESSNVGHSRPRMVNRSLRPQ